MNGLQIAGLGAIAVFYLAYFLKMFLQRRRGIQTHQMGKGSKAKHVLFIEVLLKIATLGVVPIEIVSIFVSRQQQNDPIYWWGIAIAALGVLVFISAMYTMRDSWRAGIPESDKTELVTSGVYRFSRNPAFLGFDLLYLGILLAFFNPVHLLAVIFTVLMLHLQILQEEAYLVSVFGDKYRVYKEHTGRYFLIF